MKYTIDIIETLKKSVEIEADNCYEALDKVENMYNSQEIVLTADNFDNVHFEENFGSFMANTISQTT